MSTGTFQLRTLGRLTLTRPDGCEDPSLSTRPRKLALLAWLALRPERRATRDRIIGVFWGDRDEERARNSLSDAVSHLRRALGRDALVTQASELVIPADVPLAVDALELGAAAARGDHARVVDLFRGPFLEGFYIDDATDFEEWRDRERARIARLFVKSAAAHCEALSAAGAWEQCRDVAERWLDEEPASRDAGLALLRAIAAPGTHAARAAALSAYDGLAERLDRELGIGPDATVSSFAREIAATLPPPLPPAPTPVAVESPRVPAPASTTVAADAPRRSWRRAAWPTAGAAVAVIAVTSLRARPVDSQRVIVAAFQNETGDTSLAQLGAVAADWVSRGLTETRAIEVADPLLSVRAGTPHDPRAIGRDAHATLVVLGSYVRRGDSIAMSARLVDAVSGRVLRTTAPAVAPRADPLAAVNVMRQRLAGVVAAEVDPVIARLSREASQPPTYDAYLAWVEGVELFSRHDFRASVAPLLRAAAIDSNFVSPRIWAMAAYGNTGDLRRADSILQTLLPLRARLAPIDRGLVGVWAGDIGGDRMAEYQAAREMLAAAPGSELSLFLAGLAAIYVNRPEEGASYLRRIPVESSAALWDVYGTQLAWALHLAGRHDEEIRETTRRLARQPSSMGAMFDHARALVALGRVRDAVEMARRILERGHDPSRSPGSAAFDVAGELTVHGHRAEALEVYRAIEARLRALPADSARSRVAQIERAATLCRVGKFDEADSVARAVLDTAATDVAFLRWHGEIAAARGDRAEAMRTAQRLAAIARPYLRGSNTMARAEIMAQLGDKSEATRLARQALAEGFTAATLHLLAELASLRGYPPFDALVKPEG